MPKLPPTKALDHVSVRGFRSIKSVEKLELDWLNVLIGANGAGKSNFVEVFRFLRAVRRGALRDYTAGGADRLLHLGSKTSQRLVIELSFEGGTNGYHIALAPTEADELSVRDEWGWFWDPSRFNSPMREPLPGANGEAGISREQEGSRRKIADYVREHLDSWVVYHFHDTSASSPMKKTADVDDNRMLRADGSNLASYLHLVRTDHPAQYEMIRDAIQQVAPFFLDFELEPLRRNTSKIKLEWRHRQWDRYLDASSLSDGTLRFICLAALFLGPERPSVVLLDEPELGLHPSALAVLAGMVRSVAKRTQVVVATQSPILLDHFEPEHVLVAELRDGATSLERLGADALRAWLEEYSLGELWEKNQLGGRPGA